MQAKHSNPGVPINCVFSEEMHSLYTDLSISSLLFLK